VLKSQTGVQSRDYADQVGLLAVDVSMFGVVMSADSQPIEALDGQTRILVPEGRLRKCPIVVRNEGGFAGFTGYVGTEEIDGRTTKNWLIEFGKRNAGLGLADYAAALGQELTAVWSRLALESVLEILISGIEAGAVRFWFVRNSQGLYDHDWTYKPPRQSFDVVDDLDTRYIPRDLRTGQTKEELLRERMYSFRQGVCCQPPQFLRHSVSSSPCSTSSRSKASSRSNRSTTLRTSLVNAWSS
jgi:hypothetical protein